jgi:hypothetical protein
VKYKQGEPLVSVIAKIAQRPLRKLRPCDFWITLRSAAFGSWYARTAGTSGNSPTPLIFPEPSRAVRCDTFSRTSSFVQVLSLHVVKGKKGFVCIAERSWMGPINWPEFWNPNVRGPVCFNPPAVRSVVPITYKRAELAPGGLSWTQLIASMHDAIRKRGLSALEPGAT